MRGKIAYTLTIVHSQGGIENRTVTEIRRVSIITRRPLTITPPHTITIRRAITTTGEHKEAKEHAAAALEHSELLTNIPRLPTVILTNDDRTRGFIKIAPKHSAGVHG